MPVFLPFLLKKFAKPRGVPKKKGSKSISSGAKYVIVHSKLVEEMSKNAGSAQHNCTICSGW
jgi:hypothetical protein